MHSIIESRIEVMSLRRDQMDLVKELRRSMKSSFPDTARMMSDQQKGLAPPPLEKPLAEGMDVIELPAYDSVRLLNNDFMKLVKDRRSTREFKDEPMGLDQLSWLLWATQGVHGIFRGRVATRRTVPSAGSRHAFETYVFAFNVKGLKKGIYRYLAIEHGLTLVKEADRLEELLSEACNNQAFIGKSAAAFAWTAIPYRSEWRYPLSAHKVLLLDAGHVCQNMYLAAGAIGFGTCAVAAYDQSSIDKLLGVDGDDEFTLYLAPVGKLP